MYLTQIKCAKGMLQIAIDMLIGDRIKFLILIIALSFSTLLMTQQSAVFWGVMRWQTSLLRNTNVPIWVVDPHVSQSTDIKPLGENDLPRVKSVKGVEWALPFYFGVVQARLNNGDFWEIHLIGVDDTTLLGIPPNLIKGSLSNLFEPRAVIIDEAGVKKFSEGLSKPLDVGDVFDINDHEVKIVGIVQAESTFTGAPFVYTPYNRALEIVPYMRRNLAAILVQPKPNVNIKDLITRINTETGLRAYTTEDFFWSTMLWYFKNTGIPISFGTTIILGFIVGLAVSAQTFYSFVNENLANIGALKAMGASEKLLTKMLLVQVSIAAFIGYGIGLGLTAIFGFISLQTQLLPVYLSWEIPFITLVMIVLISLAAAYLGIRKVRKFEASEVFRV